MKDLDFDELDQAVSSVLGGDTPNEKKEAPSESPAAPQKQPSAVTPVSDPTEAAEPTATPVIASPARRRGQFLDMVHPKSDMTSRTPISPASRKQIGPVSKNLSVPPTSEERTEKAAAIAAAESEPKPVSHDAPAIPKTPDLPSPSADLISAAAEGVTSFDAPEPVKKDVAWPDPLDLTPENNEMSTEPDSEPADEKTEEPADDAAAPVVTPTSEPSSTPFMADTKVDKRPLGAFGTSEPEPSVTPTTGLDEQRVPEITPPELQPDVVSVESADKEFASEPDQPEQSTPDTHEAPANSGLSESIPQQYRTPVDAPDPTAHPIFDTHEYHQPLLPATNQKKKRGWLVVLIILALLVVGSALGYFAFISGF